MNSPVKIAFEQQVLQIPISKLLPTRALPKGVQESVKYRGIAASVAEVGLIEPISVARQRGGTFLILDGHVRLDALIALGGGDGRGLRRCQRRRDPSPTTSA
ncbi:ParB N-terminal domain-containing protein [Novosphingobium colocasiae]